MGVRGDAGVVAALAARFADTSSRVRALAGVAFGAVARPENAPQVRPVLIKSAGPRTSEEGCREDILEYAVFPKFVLTVFCYRRRTKGAAMRCDVLDCVDILGRSENVLLEHTLGGTPSAEAFPTLR